MTSQFEIPDILAASKDWEDYRDNLVKAQKSSRQPELTNDQIQAVREVFYEAYLIGRTSK